MSGNDGRAPLAGIRILDLGGYIAGPLAAMLLADQGAEAIRIDPPSGPLFAHRVNAVLNRGKAHLALDLKTETGRARLLELAAGADILIENFAPGVLDRLGLSAARLHTLNPGLIVLSLPGFRGNEPLAAGAKAYEGIIAATTGQYTDIHAVRDAFGLDPVYTALPLASVYAGVQGATAAVLALSRREDGVGPLHIEVPLAGAALGALSSLVLDVEDRPARYATPRLPALARSLLRGMAKAGGPPVRAQLLALARQAYPALMTSYPCADGRLLYLFAIDNARLARHALHALGLLDEMLAAGLVFLDPYRTGDRRDNLAENSNLSRRWQARLKRRIAARLATRPAAEWEVALSAAGVPCAIQRDTGEWLALPELAAAGLTVPLDDPQHGRLCQPGPQAWLAETPPRPAPRCFPTTVAWRTAGRPPLPPPVQADSGIGHWLAGHTVVDLSSMIAGPAAARALAEYGARVIRVEDPAPRHGPRMTRWYGLDVNQGKESILLDLKSAAGREAMHRLLGQADVLIANHGAEAMARLGLAAADLRAVNPALVDCRIDAYGGPLGGPWAGRRGYDPVLQAASGIMTRYGSAKAPDLHGVASAVDALTGASAAFGIALALHRRRGDGRGRPVGTSLAAAATLVQLPAAFSEPAAAGHIFEGLYRSRTGWLFLAAPRASPSLAALVRGIPRLDLDSALRMLADAGLSAVPVRRLADLRPLLAARPASAGLHLLRRNLPGIGTVTTAPPLHAFCNGSLTTLAPARRPGEDTATVIGALGLPVTAPTWTCATADRRGDDYLPP